MKLYIAASSKELDRAELWIARTKEAGFTNTFDWTVSIRENGGGNSFPFIEKQIYARRDRAAIDEAEAFWFLTPKDHITFGGTWEFGYAHASAKYRVAAHLRLLVIASGVKKDAHIFTTLVPMFESDEDAFEYLLVHRAG